MIKRGQHKDWENLLTYSNNYLKRFIMDKTKLKNFFQKLYNFSVSIFIIGIVGTANGWEYGPDVMTTGGVTLAIIFFLRAFAPTERD
ncbi:MAG: hypothetical protein P8L64_03825 [Flavobacteriales bacterium]|nr:hypothetical protein [Flavobacteriales bacterium]